MQCRTQPETQLREMTPLRRNDKTSDQKPKHPNKLPMNSPSNSYLSFKITKIFTHFVLIAADGPTRRYMLCALCHPRRKLRDPRPFSMAKKIPKASQRAIILNLAKPRDFYFS